MIIQPHVGSKGLRIAEGDQPSWMWQKVEKKLAVTVCPIKTLSICQGDVHLASLALGVFLFLKD